MAEAITTGRRAAHLEGFSLHVDVGGPARRREQVEKLCRYIVRPPLALDRRTASPGGQLLYPFRRAWRDGSTALPLEPLVLFERLPGLVPPPRRPLLAYHGRQAPRSRWRAAIVPTAASDAPRAAAQAGISRRWPWARLLQRVFGFAVWVCDRCGGPRRILGAVTEPAAVCRVLVTLGLGAQPPPGPVVSAA